ncbi:MAG: hypothetical protein KA354_10735 [Phycisphaerae bacterium]|nr:hypothetical protein [Phycisphaerae bacterium]
MSTRITPPRTSWNAACIATAATLLLGTATTWGQGFTGGISYNRAHSPSLSGPSRSLTNSFAMMSGQSPANGLDTRRFGAANTIQNANAMSSWQRMGARSRANTALSSPFGQQGRASLTRLAVTGSSLASPAAAPGLNYRPANPGNLLTRLTPGGSRRGPSIGDVVQGSRSFDATVISWQNTTNYYAGGFLPSSATNMNMPTSENQVQTAKTTTPRTTSGPAPDGSETPVEPTQIITPGAGQFTPIEAERQRLEADRQLIEERRSSYEARGKERFKQVRYQEARDLLMLAETVAQNDLEQRARVRLLLFYTHIATEEYNQATADLRWLATFDRTAREYRGLKALQEAVRDPAGLSSTLFRDQPEFATISTKVRLSLPSKEPAYIAIRAMMAWAERDATGALALSKEAAAAFRAKQQEEERKKSEKAQAPARATDESARLYEEMNEWPIHFTAMMSKAAAAVAATPSARP